MAEVVGYCGDGPWTGDAMQIDTDTELVQAEHGSVSAEDVVLSRITVLYCLATGFRFNESICFAMRFYMTSCDTPPSWCVFRVTVCMM